MQLYPMVPYVSIHIFVSTHSFLKSFPVKLSIPKGIAMLAIDSTYHDRIARRIKNGERNMA